MKSASLNQVSEQLLLSVKMDVADKELITILARHSIGDLEKELNNDEKKNAFWINIYNALFQILRKEEKMAKPEIYRKRSFNIAQQMLSLDDVEHGILRKFRYKYSLGLFANPFTSKVIKRLAVDKLDYRIHFALNCGAESCPPIAFYNPEQIDQQLNMATQSFLESESDFDEIKKIVHTTTLFKWFHADFGGTNGIKKIFKEQLDKDISEYSIKFKDYSWKEILDNYV